ncbi:MAG TPA: hypothetical protein VJ824_16780 [Bacillota bacterium]|nr:hypothetical protein [Bacillota bacterium]
MANNQLTKWFIGLSSVALFTGFIGLTERYDQDTQSAANTKSNSMDTQMSRQDAIRQEWRSTDSITNNNNGVASNHHSAKATSPTITNQQPQLGSTNGTTSNSERMRSRAS